MKHCTHSKKCSREIFQAIEQQSYPGNLSDFFARNNRENISMFQEMCVRTKIKKLVAKKVSSKLRRYWKSLFINALSFQFVDKSIFERKMLYKDVLKMH